MFRFEGTVLVTGASAGIGEATAVQFASAGARVILVARRKERLDALKASIEAKVKNAKVLVQPLDVTDTKAVLALPETLPKEFRDVDVLVNNAGLALGVDKIEDLDVSVIDTILGVNVKAVLVFLRAFIPGMKARGRGSIINVGSIAGTEAYPHGGLYCASKHAVQGLTDTLRRELFDTPLRVCNIRPGLVETEFSVVRFRGDEKIAKSVYSPLKYGGPLLGQDIADAIVYVATRPPHVQVADMVIFPTSQADCFGNIAKNK